MIHMKLDVAWFLPFRQEVPSIEGSIFRLFFLTFFILFVWSHKTWKIVQIFSYLAMVIGCCITAFLMLPFLFSPNGTHFLKYMVIQIGVIFVLNMCSIFESMLRHYTHREVHSFLHPLCAKTSTFTFFM